MPDRQISSSIGALIWRSGIALLTICPLGLRLIRELIHPLCKVAPRGSHPQLSSRPCSSAGIRNSIFQGMLTLRPANCHVASLPQFGSQSVPESVTRSDVQIRYIERVFLNEFPSRFNCVAHDDREHRVGAYGIVHRLPQQRARFGVHCRFPELLGIHLTKSLVALERRPMLRQIEHRLDHLVDRLYRHLLAVLLHHYCWTAIERREFLVEIKKNLIVTRFQNLNIDVGGYVALDVDHRTFAVLTLVNFDLKLSKACFRSSGLKSIAPLRPGYTTRRSNFAL